MILGVAFSWSDYKGLDVFIELSHRLPIEYRIVMVGTDDQLDMILPSNIISIHATKSQKELAAIYTAADLFINPTREEVFGLTNIESLACGTPVIAFDTGGCPEIIDSSCGSIVSYGNVDELEQEIYKAIKSRVFSSKNCIIKAEKFAKNDKYEEYLSLYDEKVP